MRRVCSFDSVADFHFHGEYFIGDPFIESLDCFPNFCAAADEKRDAITDGETQFLPQPLNPAHQLPSQTLQPELTRHRRIERGKIAGFLLYYHVARGTSDNGQIFSAQLMRIISDRNVQRLSSFEISQRVAAQSLNRSGSEWRFLAELLTQRTEIRPSL